MPKSQMWWLLAPQETPQAVGLLMWQHFPLPCSSSLFFFQWWEVRQEGFHAVGKKKRIKCGTLQFLQWQLLKPSWCLNVTLLLTGVGVDALPGAFVHQILPPQRVPSRFLFPIHY